MTTFLWSDHTIRNPSSFGRTRITPGAAMQSPLTGAIQTASREGARWSLRCEWVVWGAQRAELEALLSRLNGMEHRLALPMFDQANRGTWSGTPVVDGAGQTGGTLNIRGGSGSETNYARAGDFFRYDNCVRMVMADADSTLGDATLEIWPPIRTSPADGASIVHAAPEGVYIMRQLAEVPLEDVLASGEMLSRIEAVFEDDVLA